MSRAPSADARQERRRSSSCARSSALPSRRPSSALEDYPQTAVTRAIYHHARAYLAKAGPANNAREKCCRAVCAVRSAARAVILESTVIQIVLRCVEQTKQRQARQADEMWRRLAGDVRFLFGGHRDIDSVAIAETLAEMLSGFDGADDVRSRFLNVAKSFNNSEVALKQLQVSFGNNLEGLHAMRSDFDRFTAEIIRLVSLLEGDCNSMRVQLQRTLKSPRQRVNRNMFGGLEKLGKGRMMLHDMAGKGEDSQDHIASLLSTLEHDLCDTPLAAMVQVAQDVNDHIVKQLNESGNLQVLHGREDEQEADLSATTDEPTSPTKVVTDLFQVLRPCVFEAADASSKGKLIHPQRKAPKGVEQEPCKPEARVIVSPSSPVRPPVDVLYARAQLARDSGGPSTAASGSSTAFDQAQAGKSSKSSTAALGCVLPSAELSPGAIEQRAQRLPKLKPLPHVPLDPEQSCPSKELSNRSINSTTRENLTEARAMMPPTMLPGYVEQGTEHMNLSTSTASVPAGPTNNCGDCDGALRRLRGSGGPQSEQAGRTEEAHGAMIMPGCMQSSASSTGGHMDGAANGVTFSHQAQEKLQGPIESAQFADKPWLGHEALTNRHTTPEKDSLRQLDQLQAGGQGTQALYRLSPVGFRSMSQPNLEAKDLLEVSSDNIRSSYDDGGLLMQEHRLPQTSQGVTSLACSEDTGTESRPAHAMASTSKGKDGRRSSSLPLNSEPRRLRQSGPSALGGRAVPESAEFARFMASEREGHSAF